MVDRKLSEAIFNELHPGGMILCVREFRKRKSVFNLDRRKSLSMP